MFLNVLTLIGFSILVLFYYALARSSDIDLIPIYVIAIVTLIAFLSGLKIIKENI